MTTEAPKDATTSAVEEVIRTMNGDAAHSAGATPEDQIADDLSVAAKQPPERLNVNLEDRLVGLGVFGRRSMAQRRILGCLGCKLATQPGNTASLRSGELAQCNNMQNTAVRRILAKLVTGGFLKTEHHEEDERKGKPPDYFRLTGRAVEYAFKRALEIPSRCGLGAEGPVRINDQAEALLLDAGVFELRGSTPRIVLGCLACKQQKGEGIHVKALQRCAGIPTSHSLNVLRRMAEGGILEAREESGVALGGHRVTYGPADTELGRKIAEIIEKPARCGLEEGK